MKNWRFISNQNSTIVGINDAGIETFTAYMHRSLVRESIQNSLDAALPGEDVKVTVDFAWFDMPRDNIPGIDKLQDAMKKCRQSNAGEPDALKFFQEAERLLLQPTVKVLRVSDHNTIGLEGSGTCAKGTSWSRLVKESGSSNKGQSSGGSFGIGKSAAFACSDLRTVFYSSLDSIGLKSNFGVARLVSFQDEETGGWTTGTGYYSEDARFTAIPELADYDPTYIRSDSGTDIYILGMHMTENFVDLFVRAVLLDFLVSIVQGKLIVNVQGETVDRQSLPKYIAELNPYDGEEIKDLVAYYHLLTSSDPTIRRISLDASIYGGQYGFQDGECTLYLKEGAGLNRKILITRKAGMRILEQNRISGSIEFIGVLIMEGSNMNEAFKKMEVPSHDAWEPGRCRGEEGYYNSILQNLKRYLRNTVKECYGRVSSDSMDAIGANDFLPDRMAVEGNEKARQKALSTSIDKLEEKTVEPTKKRTKVMDFTVERVHEDGGDEGRRTGRGHHTGMNPYPEAETGAVPGSGKQTGQKNAYQEMTVKKRLICSDAKAGVYTLSFIVPETTSKGKLEFVLAGEQSDFKLPLQDVKIISAGQHTRIDSYTENTAYLKDLSKGEKIKLEVKIGFDAYCMMEVDYYAYQK